MELQCHFTRIREVIAAELLAAQSDVTVAIAWLTDPELFEALLAAARRGVRIRLALLDDEINRRSGINLERLRALGAPVFCLPPGEGQDGGLHHKFCTIDRDVVITGSYNWTRRASRAGENILVVRGEPSLADGYLAAFDALLNKYGFAQVAPRIDSLQMHRRMTVILNLLQMGDTEALEPQLDKLRHATDMPGVARLLALLADGDRSAAEALLGELIARSTAVVPSEATEVAELKLELRTLEAFSVAMSAEKAEIEQTIRAFSRAHHEALNDVLTELLLLRIELHQRQAEFSSREEDVKAREQAEEDYGRWKAEAEVVEREPKPLTLSPDEQEELKRLFRGASMLCHPDRVAEAEKEQATAAFVALREAYEREDLDAVRRLRRNLKQGKPFTDLADTVSKVDHLRRQVSRLRIVVEQISAQIVALRTGETWRTIEEAGDWPDWFAVSRRRIEAECARLKAALMESAIG